MKGIIIFFKPKGITSHDAVNIFRRIFNMKRIGHTGTLDPNVTGVLPMCIGKATRVSEYLLNADKEYVCELSLGYATDTQDSSGNIMKTSSKTVTKNEIIQTINSFQGKILQTPPMYSAVRYKGKRLYEMAREGKTVKRKPRQVEIHHIKILHNQNNEKIIFSVKCSSGTYIRTLCHDIGKNLGTYGYMSYLIRVGVGKFQINNAVSREYLESATKESLKKILLPMDLALDNLEELLVSNEFYKQLINGVLIPISDIDLSMDKLYKVYCQNKFIGIGKIILKHDLRHLKMDKVLI